MKNPALSQFVRERPALIWYTHDYDALDEASVVEHVLNYGTWEDFKEMIQIMGIERAAHVFRENAFGERTNYRKRTRHFFDLYFKRHVHA